MLQLIFNMCWKKDTVPVDWGKVVIVPLYKGKWYCKNLKKYIDERKCMDLVFFVGCISKMEEVYCPFVDLKRAYFRVVRYDLWKTCRLSVYGISSRRSVPISLQELQLFNLIFVNYLVDLKKSECGLKMNEVLVKCLLYVDEHFILAKSTSSAKQLQETVTVMHEAFERKGMMVGKCK